MHRVNVKINYFFVPNRLVWDEWQDFITGINQKATYDPTNPSGYFTTKIPPFWTLNSQATSTTQSYFKDGSLADFLGFPTMRANQTVQGSVDVQLLPFRAYQAIYNDWFRNQNVEAPINIPKTSGATVTALTEMLKLRKRMWEKDYFTSCLPFAQRGDAVDIPNAGIRFDASGKTVLKDTDGSSFLPGTSSANQTLHASGDSNDVVIDTKDASGAVIKPVNIDNSSNLKVNMGTINDLRLATHLQKWLEVNARVGGRYIEQILGHFGIHSSDARLQRCEYLGGWSSPIIVSDVEQTSAYAGTSQGAVASTPQGNLAGKGTAYGNSNYVKCFCEEHGFIFGILSILPRTSYQDGLPKMFQRNYKEDYYFPEFAHLGEQEVNKAEVYFNIADSNAQSFDRFGFQERFCEYKYLPSTVHGEFKSNLQFWHLGRDFTSAGQPALNKTFVESNPRNNIFAVLQGANHFYVNLINHVHALRPMPRQAIPSL